MIRNFVPNLWSKPVNPRMGVVLTLLIARNGRKNQEARSSSNVSLSLSLSLIRELCVFSRSYLVWTSFLNFLKIAQKFRV